MKATILPSICFSLILITSCQTATETVLPTPEVIVKECTAEGCGTSLMVFFEGEVPPDFVMAAQSQDGAQLEVQCVNGEGDYSPDYFRQESFMMCQGETVEIINFSPPTFSISVDSSGRSLSQDYAPHYDLVYPNGPDCEPECRVGSIVFSMPPSLSFEPATYRDEPAGFEFDYPAEWTKEGPQVIGPRGYIAQFTSYPHPPGDIPDIQPEGSSQLQTAVMLWDPKGDLDAYIEQRKMGWASSGNTIISEQEHALAGDLQAASFVIDSFGTQAYFLLAAVGEKYLVISGQGDIDLLNEIALTLRPLE